MNDIDDDRDRVSREDDHLRHATVLLDDTEVYVIPVDDFPEESRRRSRTWRRRVMDR